MPEATSQAPRSSGAEYVRLVALPGGRSGAVTGAPLPSQVSSFVGRESELSEIVQVLRTHRLVTLTGVGGIGKTRLALAVAGELDGIFPDGVWVIELAPIADPGLLPRGVAAAVGISERPGQSLTDTLAEVLRRRTALLVLDNCEHLIGACAALAAALLQACPEVKILTTSREVLGIVGEVGWPVPPLREAAQLFDERAATTRPGFAVTADNAAAVARIVDGLDGLPLALELAATRVRVLSVQEIADRLGDSLPLLVGERTAAARHHTLTATFDWSHALLSPAEQTLFRRLSIFRGGFTLAAAEAVCTGGDLAAVEVLPVLSELVEKSLVIADPTDATTRYRLLEVVRQYAGERQRGAPADDVELPARHARYYLGVAVEADRRSVGYGEPAWLDRIAAEHDNLRTALSWLGEHDEASEAAELAGSLWPFWFVRGFSQEGIGWLRAATGRTAPGERAARARAKALNGLGVLAAFQQDYLLARLSGQQALSLYRHLTDVDGVATCLLALSTTAVAGQLADVDVAALLSEAGELQPQVRDRRVLGHLRHVEGAVALVAGDSASAVRLWQQALGVHRDAQDLIGEAFTMANLGLLFARSGDAEQAAPLLVDTLRLSLRLDYKLIIQYCLLGLGKLAADGGRLQRAALLWGAAEAMEETFGAHLTRAGRVMLGVEAQVASARARIAEPTWQREWSAGRRMSADHVVAYALNQEDAAPAEGQPGGLTAREADVLRLVARGLTSAQVGRELFLSPRTVDWHLSSVYAKLGVRSRTEAARFAVDHGLG